MADYEQQITAIIESDPLRLQALRAVSQLGLTDCMIAAGFVRNAIWDSQYGLSSPLNDIDVVYFCRQDTAESRDQALQQQLNRLLPGLPWSVKNQARMHHNNGDRPYCNTLDAMQYWPEKQTSIGLSLDARGNIIVHHCFALSIQFDGTISRNPARSIEIFERRVINKGWLKTWPGLSVRR